MRVFLVLALALVAMVSETESLKLSGWGLHKGKGLKQISVGPVGVWGVSKKNRVYVRVGKKWKVIDGSIAQVSVGRKWVWGVNAVHQIWARKGIKGRWINIRGRLTQVSD